MTNSFPKKTFDKNRKFGKQDHGPRRNERIRVAEIRVIGPDGKQLGVMDTRIALQQAKSLGLDLVEISPNSNPPVCRICDYGKFKYEEEKKNKNHQKSAASKVKELKFRPSVDVGDYQTKISHGREFLQKGSKLKLTLMFRGREMAYQELGFEVINRAINDLQEFGTLDSPAKLTGRNITTTMSPRSTKAIVKNPTDNAE